MSIPGWIDLQVNGYNGVNFSDPNLSLADIEKVNTQLFELGTIGYCPTIISSSLEVYRHNLLLISKAIESQEKGAKILGVHLEGPFLNPIDGYRGIHRKENIILPSIEIYEKFRSWAQNNVAIITIAPELPGALKLIKHAVRNVVISIGHSNAGKEIIQKAANLGVQAATHIGNGLPDMIPRHENNIWPILAEDDIHGFFITDGFHLPEEVIKTCLRAKKVSKFIVTSDLTHLAGQNPGNYTFNDIPVVLEPNRHLHCQDSSQLAGSASSMMECMNYLASIGELSEGELYQVGYENPLRLLNIDVNNIDFPKETNIIFQKNEFSIKSNIA